MSSNCRSIFRKSKRWFRAEIQCEPGPGGSWNQHAKIFETKREQAARNTDRVGRAGLLRHIAGRCAAESRLYLRRHRVASPSPHAVVMAKIVGAERILSQWVKFRSAPTAVFYSGGMGPVFDLASDPTSIALIESLRRAARRQDGRWRSARQGAQRHRLLQQRGKGGPRRRRRALPDRDRPAIARRPIHQRARLACPCRHGRQPHHGSEPGVVDRRRGPRSARPGLNGACEGWGHLKTGVSRLKPVSTRMRSSRSILRSSPCC
jgi:hypothetical protein